MNYERIEVFFMFVSIKVGSITNAQRSIHVLRSYSIRSTLSRIENPSSTDGCGYVVKVMQSDLQRALQILKDNSVTVIGVDGV